MRHRVGLIIVTALVASTAFAFGPQHPIVADAIAYDTLGWNLAQGHGFSLATEAPYVPTMLREPLYPMVLGAIYRIVGHRPGIVPVVQIGFFLTTCWFVWLLGQWLFSPKVAWWAGMIMATHPTLANYPSYLLVESLFTALLVGGVVAICYATRQAQWWWWAVAGVVLGLATLCKAVAGPLALLCALSVVVIRRPDWSGRRAFVQAGVVLLCWLAVVGPWMVRNERVFGSAQLALRGELTLWMRANKLDDGRTKILQASVYNFSEYLGQTFFPDAATSPREFILEDSHLALRRERTLMAEGFSQVEAHRQIGHEAVARILAQPLKYVMYTPIEAIKLTAFSYVPTLNERHVSAWFTQRPYGRFILAMLRGTVRLLGYGMLAFACYGMWVRRADWHVWWPLGLLIVWFNGIHVLLFALGRYVVPIIPAYAVLAAVGIEAWRRRKTSRVVDGATATS